MPMAIYLVQHGEAKRKDEDPERPLTDKGRSDAEKVAIYVGNQGIEVASIIHSGKLRAQQTAEIFAKHLSPAQGVAQQQGLEANDDPESIKRLISEATESIMIVGHLPHLIKLASLLILGDPEKKIINFINAGVVCLSLKDSKWMLNWAVTPEIIH
jgi:phosphohistidine phosphatase